MEVTRTLLFLLSVYDKLIDSLNQNKMQFSIEEQEVIKDHINYLRNEVKQENFDMGKFAPSGKGTCGCALHYLIKRGIMTHTEASKLFDAELSEYTHWLYMFSALWAQINNTPQAAAARMEAVLYNQVPKSWRFTSEFAHPIVIVPEEELVEA